MAGEIKFDKNIAKAIDNLLKDSPKWITMAVNQTLRGIRTDVTGKKIGARKDLNVKLGQVRDLITITQSTKTDLKGVVSISRKQIPAFDKLKGWGGGNSKPGMHFSGKRTNRPRAKSKITNKKMIGKAYKYSFKFFNANGMKTFNNAFPAKMSSGHTGIFIRKDGGRKLKEIYSSSVADVTESQRISALILASASTRMTENIIRQMNRILK